MNYSAYYATIGTLITLFGFAITLSVISRRRCKKAPAVVVEQGSALMHAVIQGDQLTPIKARRLVNTSRDKVLAELNKRTEHWAKKKRIYRVSAKRQMLIIWELKKLVDQDQYKQICTAINTMPEEQMLELAAGK